MCYKFDPSKEIRSLDSKNFIGKMVNVKLGHTEGKEKRNQYISITAPFFHYNISYLCGWVNKYMGKEGTSYKRKVRSFYLIERSNGGRSSSKRYSSYGEYYSDRKKEILEYWKNSSNIYFIEHYIDLCDIGIILSDGTHIESIAFGVRAPEEWKSEIHKNNPNFKFADGFYPSSYDAISAFSKKYRNDIFGTRFFPVLVFNSNIKNTDVKDILWIPKSCSDAIKVGKKIVIGTRCKINEYKRVIESTYKVGGKVPVGVEWDWE